MILSLQLCTNNCSGRFFYKIFQALKKSHIAKNAGSFYRKHKTSIDLTAGTANIGLFAYLYKKWIQGVISL
jgi:hypothetical protein